MVAEDRVEPQPYGTGCCKGPLRWTLLTRDDLIDWREKQGFSHRDVALLLGVSRRTVGHYETGHRVPSRELQARMVELTRGAALEPRPHRHRPRRRHRWRHVKPLELKEWRERSGLTREDVAEILQIHTSTYSGWERDEWAPPPDTQRRLKRLIQTKPLPPHVQAPRVEEPAVEEARLPSLRASVGYDEDTGASTRGVEDMPVTAETPRTVPRETPEDDLSIRRRVTSVMALYASGEVRLPHAFAECRWGEKDGITVIASKEVKGAVYLVEQRTGSFYRTVSPESTRLCSSSPREVISEDRSWLYPLFNKIPGGKVVVQRYHHAQPAASSPTPTTTATREERPVTTTPTPTAPASPTPTPPPTAPPPPATPTATAPPPPPPAPAPSPAAQAAAQAATDRLLDLKEVEAQRVVLVSTTKFVELGPHQIHAVMRRAGGVFPDTAEVRPLATTPPGFQLEWSLTKDTKSGHYFDTEAAGTERLKVSPEQLTGIFALLGRKVEKPIVTVTPQGYVKVEWTEERYEEG